MFSISNLRASSSGSRRNIAALVLVAFVVLTALRSSSNSSRDDNTTRTNNKLGIKSPIPVSLSSVNASLTFLQSRQQAYEAEGLGLNFHLRGIAHLYEHQRVLLVGRHLVIGRNKNEDKNSNNQQNDNSNRQRHSIRIYNVYQLQRFLPQQQQQQEPPDEEGSPFEDTTARYREKPPDCERLSIWVRVSGPEIFAGKAKPVWSHPKTGMRKNKNKDDNDNDNYDSYCYWDFEFDAMVPGEYHIDAKVLLWDAANHTFREECVYIQGKNIPAEVKERYPNHVGFKGFKMYAEHEVCCEACSRQIDPPCRYWSTPPKELPDPYVSNNGCEFYFDANVTQLPFMSHLLPNGGGGQQQQQQQNHSTVASNTDGGNNRERELLVDMSEVHYYHGFPRPPPVAYFLGCGWNTMFTLDFPCLSAALDDKVFLEQESFTIAAPKGRPKQNNNNNKNAAALPICQIYDELQSGPGPLPGRWVKEPWPDNTTCPQPYKTKHFRKSILTLNDGNHPHCWFRDDLDEAGLRCLEMNCRHIPTSSKWKSPYFCHKRWMGVWRRYDCDYYEYTDAQLEQCFQQRKIHKLKIEGLSVANFLQDFLDHRLEHLRLYDNNVTGDGVTATLTTLGLVHQVIQPEHKFNHWIESFPDFSLDDKQLVYVVSGYFLSSEREIHAQMEKMQYFNNILKSQLVPKGYHYLNAFDLSAAMSYEVAAQLDGMHLIGPPAKMVITKFLHHLCSDVVPGSRL